MGERDNFKAITLCDGLVAVVNDVRTPVPKIERGEVIEAMDNTSLHLYMEELKREISMVRGTMDKRSQSLLPNIFTHESGMLGMTREDIYFRIN